jgi:hypothetical protein
MIMKKILLNIHPALLKRVDGEAKHQRLTRTDLIRVALEDYLLGKSYERAQTITAR